MDGALELHRLRKLYGETVAVDDVSLTVGSGEFVTLLGPSGSGKTTTLLMVAGFVQPTSGSITLSGNSLTRLPPYKRNIGMVFQHYALFPHMTVRDNIAFPLEMRRMNRKEIASRVEDALELVRLPDYGDRYPRELSGGQQQRVALARAIVFQPKLLLMDEPLGALDKKLREAMQLEIKRIHKQLGVTVIYVTHDQEEALSLSDRIAVMFRGRIAQLGTPEEIYQDPATREVFEFVGEGNYLDGEVTEIDGDSVVVTLSTGDGVRAELGGRSGAGRPLSKGTQVVVSFRPHEVEVVPQGAHGDPPGENTLRGTVQHLDYLGAIVRYHVDIGKGMTLLAEHYTAQGVPARQGDQLTVRIPPARVKLFDTDGMRIRGRGS